MLMTGNWKLEAVQPEIVQTGKLALMIGLQ